MAQPAHSAPEQPAEDEAITSRDTGRRLFPTLSLQDMVAASSTCSGWQRAAMPGWKQRALARWRVWRAPRAAASLEWQSLYKQRHLADRRVFDLLADACWPERHASVMEQLLQQGDDAVDVLATIAHSCHTGSSADDGGSSSRGALFLGVAFHARMALAYVRGDRCAARLQQLLAQQQAGSAAGAAGDDGVLEVALLLTQVLHPLGDIAGVRRLVGELAAELTRRMGDAGVGPGSKWALELLNQLLFGPPPAQQQQQQQAVLEPAPAADLEGSSSSSSASASASASAGWRCWWLRDEQLDGPDLSRVQVPRDGVSGLGVRGNTADYYNVANCCLDSVLATRRGLPITIAVLHKAVGNAAGMSSLQLLNMPGHVINAAQLDSGERLFIDVFDGGKLCDEQGLREIMSRHIPPGALAAMTLAQQLLAAGGLAPMGACDVARRCLANVLSFHEHQLVGQMDRSREPTGRMYMQSIGVSMLAMEVAALAGPHSRGDSVLLDKVVGAIQRGLDRASDVLLLQRLVSRPSALINMGKLRDSLAEVTAGRRETQHARAGRAETDPVPQHSVGDRALQVPPHGMLPQQLVLVLGWMQVSMLPHHNLLPTLTYWVLEPSGQRSMRAADGSLLSMMVTSKLQKLPGAAASPAARAAWAASYAAARPLQLAHLAAGWFERGFGLPPDPPRVAELVAGWPVMEAGRFFEAAWHDEAADCCAFVPNAELAHRYPDG